MTAQGEKWCNVRLAQWVMGRILDLRVPEAVRRYQSAEAVPVGVLHKVHRDSQFVAAVDKVYMRSQDGGGGLLVGGHVVSEATLLCRQGSRHDANGAAGGTRGVEARPEHGVSAASHGAARSQCIVTMRRLALAFAGRREGLHWNGVDWLLVGVSPCYRTATFQSR